MKYFFVCDAQDHVNRALAGVFEQCALEIGATVQTLVMDTPEKRAHMKHFLHTVAKEQNRALPFVVQYNEATGQRAVVPESDMQPWVVNLCVTHLPPERLRHVLHTALGPYWAVLLGAPTSEPISPPKNNGGIGMMAPPPRQSALSRSKVGSVRSSGQVVRLPEKALSETIPVDTNSDGEEPSGGLVEQSTVAVVSKNKKININEVINQGGRKQT
jgi:hypothetical protein